MAVKILDVEDAIEDNGLKILGYGNAGAGKTVSCATSGMPTIILSAESGLLSLKKFIRDNPALKGLLKTIIIKNVDDLREALEMFQTSPVRLCNWIDLDSISEIAEQILKYEKENNLDKRAAYGNLTDVMLDILRQFRDLPYYNVYMTAKMVRGEDADGRSYYMPLFPGKGVANNIPYMFDEVFALRAEEIEDDKGNVKIKRFFQTSPDSKYIAKDRSGELDVFEKVNLAHIYKKIRGYDEVSYELDEETAKKYSMAIIDLKANDSGDSDDEAITHEADTYWYHIAKNKWLCALAGDDLTALLDDTDKIKQVSKKEYDAKKLTSVDVEEEVDEPANVDSDTPTDDAVIQEEEIKYWSSESGELLTTEEGQDISEYVNSDDWEEINKKMFLKLQAEQEQEEDENEEDEPEEIISDKIQYWRHNGSGGCIVTEPDTILNNVLENPEVEEITKGEYKAWLAEQPIEEDEDEEEKQPVNKKPLTALQRARKEQDEKNAAKK
jgi:hypothetical protein